MMNEVCDDISQLKIDHSPESLEEINQIFSNVETFTDGEKLSKINKDLLKSKFIAEPSKTLILIENTNKLESLLSCLTKQDSLTYLSIITANLRTPSHWKSIKFYGRLTIGLLTNFNYTIEEVSPVFSNFSSVIIEEDFVKVVILKFVSKFGDNLNSLIEETLEVLSLKKDYQVVLTFITFIFQIQTSGNVVKLFNNEEFQVLLNSIKITSSKSLIKKSLEFLSISCNHEELRSEVSKKYSKLLIEGLKVEELQTLCTLILIKIWKFQDLKIDELVDILLNNLDEYSIEGLTFLSLKPSIRIKLRADDEFIFDLCKLLSSSSSSNEQFGVVSILSNLSMLPDTKSEVSKLKAHAQKGLEETEDIQDIESFNEDLIEREVIGLISKFSSLSVNSLQQSVKLIYNVSTIKNSAEIIKQGGLKIILQYLSKSDELNEFKIISLKALSRILVHTNPSLILDKSKTILNYLFEFLSIEDQSMKSKFECLISLTNLSVLDNGVLTSSQWDIIDDYLLKQDVLIRRGTIELVSNLMQHKSSLPYLFNFEKPKVTQRFDLIVSYFLLDDLKSQCSAVGSFTFGIGVPMIAQEVAIHEKFVHNLTTVLQEQYKEEELCERVLFVLYHLIIYNEAKFKGNSTLKTAVEHVVSYYSTGQVLELAEEIKSLL